MGRRKSELRERDYEAEFVCDASRPTQKDIDSYRKMKLSISVNPFEVKNKNPNKDYYWGGKTVLNEKIPNTLESLRSARWEPEKNSDHPDRLEFSETPSTSSSGLVEKEGLVLLGRDKIYGMLDREEEMEIRKQRMKGLGYAPNLGPCTTGTKLKDSSLDTSFQFPDLSE